MLIDTHAHLAHHLLSNDIEGVIQRASQAGLIGICCIGTTLEDSTKCCELATRFDCVRAAVGLHPNDCCKAQAGDWQEIEALAQDAAVVALGETGLDRHWDDCPWEVQVDFFRQHIQLSRETRLPVVIHTRDCAEETLELMQTESKNGPFTGVMHSFTGSIDVARGCLELGLYISFAGMITFKNAADLRGVAAQIPLDRILIETDSPYLTPHPHRGHRPNEPAMLRHTLNSLAELFQISPVELAQRTTSNAQRLFGAWR